MRYLFGTDIIDTTNEAWLQATNAEVQQAIADPESVRPKASWWVRFWRWWTK